MIVLVDNVLPFLAARCVLGQEIPLCQLRPGDVKSCSSKVCDANLQDISDANVGDGCGQTINTDITRSVAKTARRR